MAEVADEEQGGVDGQAGCLERGTVGFRLTPTRVVAKRKLSQNRPAEVVETIIAELSGDGVYAQPALADEMRRALDARRAPTP